MKRIIFAIHGIRSKAPDNWVFKFTDFAKQDDRFKDDFFMPYTYGYVPALVSIIPFFKYAEVQKLKNVLRNLIAANPNHELNIVAHSYGTELSFQTMTTSTRN